MSTTTQQIVPYSRQQPVGSIGTARKMLEDMKGQLALALPRHIRTEQFLRVALTTFRRNPDLLRCTGESLAGSLIQAAQLGLQVDGVLGEAHLVPFNIKGRKECQLIVGYKGYMKLARNSGEVSWFKARCVFAKDHLKIEEGLEPVLEYARSEDPPEVPKNGRIEDQVRGAFAIVKYRDGSVNFVFLWKWEIDRARAASKSQSERSAWVTNYPEMAEKTAIRRLAKYMPQSAEIQRAAALEDLADAGISQGLGGLVDVSEADDADEGDGRADGRTGLQAALEEKRGESTEPRQESPRTGSSDKGGESAAAAAPARPSGRRPSSAPPSGNPDYAEGDDGDPLDDERESGQED